MGLYCDWIFPRIVDWGMRAELLTRQRRDLLAGARGAVLEIGFGSGLNLPHYPRAVTSLVAIDHSRGMLRLARERIASAAFPVESRLLDGENLPSPEQRFDTVVSTWTLCSIRDVGRALREARRVLRPGGRLLFVEHGLSPEPAVRVWQRRLNPIQNRIGGGCNLNRDIAALVEGSGFRMERLELFYLDSAPKWLGYTYKGSALA